MKLFLASILAVFAVGAGAQAPVEEDILARTLDSESPYFYQPMMLRYMAGDKTLTAEHYYYLYYGYAYDPAYDAHRELPGDRVMGEIFGSGEFSKEDAIAVVAAGKANMAVDPFSPGNINLMTYAYQMLGDSLNSRISAARFRGVIGAITSSGTGLKERSPWHILRFTHANDIVAARGLTVVQRTVRSRTVEYLQVERNQAGVKGFFFDYSRVYSRPYEGKRVEKKSKWMFNGTPIK